MPYEAFANVMANIGRGIENRAAEDRAYERKLADVASERAYADRVRQEQFDKQLEMAQKQADLALETEVKRVRKLANAQLMAEAEVMGIPVTGIDGKPRDVSEVRAAIISRKEAEAAQAALSAARASAAAAADPAVLAAGAKAQRAGAEAQLNTRAELAPKAQEVADIENARTKEVLQGQLDAVQSQIQPLIAKVRSDPAASAAVSVAQDLAQKINSALGAGTQAQIEESLRQKSVPIETYRAAMAGDVAQLEVLAARLGIPVDTKSANTLAAARLNAESYTTMQLLGQYMSQQSQIMSDARRSGIVLSLSNAPAAPASTTPPAKPATSGLTLPGRSAPAAPEITHAPEPGGTYFAPPPAATPVAPVSPSVTAPAAGYFAPSGPPSYLSRLTNPSTAAQTVGQTIAAPFAATYRGVKGFLAPASSPNSWWHTP